jgi:hypothetical protein
MGGGLGRLGLVLWILAMVPAQDGAVAFGWGGVYDGDMADALLATPIKESAGLVRAGNRLTAVQLKQEIHDSGVCRVVIEMAKTGHRPVWNEQSGEVEMEVMSEAGHIDILKFIVKKVLPDAKEYDSIDDRKALDKWANVINAVPVPVEG